MEIAFKKVISATISADNSTDIDRAYHISADVHLRNGTVVVISNGTATSVTMGFTGSFTKDSQSTTYSFPGEASAEEKNSMMGAIEDFISSTMAQEDIVTLS